MQGETRLPPEPFFAGPGLDRADALRARPEEIERLRASPSARSLAWSDGAPALGADGRLGWTGATGEEALFLGFDASGAPCFSALWDGPVPTDGRAHFGMRRCSRPR